MRGRRDLIWLLAVVVVLAAAVAYTPYEMALPRPGPLAVSSASPDPSGLNAECPPAADYTPSSKPDEFTFSCTGSRHAKAYTGFKEPVNFPKCTWDAGLLEHP